LEFVAAEWMMVMSRIATIAAATHRPGCRTGTALIVSGDSVRAMSSLAWIPSADARD
jgi:hypothetical protein